MDTPDNPAPVSTRAIAHYYDSNVGYFLKLGGSGDVAAIHRAIYAPGISSKAEAFNYLNVRVAEAIKPCLLQVTGNVLDLGCGVGGTATWLAQTLPVNVCGITISARQQQLASKRANQLGLESRCDFFVADFAALPELPVMDAAVAIESFVHANNADELFASVSRSLRPGARLMICDDFLGAENSAEAGLWIQRFKQGWHLNTLQTPEQISAVAARHGLELVSCEDLSAYIRAFPAPLLWLMRHLTRLPLPWSYWRNLAGGTALQYCLARGWTRYCMLILERKVYTENEETFGSRFL